MKLKQAAAAYRRARRKYLKTQQLDDRYNLTLALVNFLRCGGKVGLTKIVEVAA
jgi:hypothetical protein